VDQSSCHVWRHHEHCHQRQSHRRVWQHGSDSVQFAPLLETTARGFQIEHVVADKAYSSRANLADVIQLGGTPFIPFRLNGRAKSREATLWDQMYHLHHLHRETFLQHYHKRSLVESTFSMMKAKFGASLRSKGDTAQMNEALCKVLCHNICVLIQSMYELGVSVEFGDDGMSSHA
jgi:transposase